MDNWDHRIERMKQVNTFTSRLASTMWSDLPLAERLKQADPDGSLTKAYNEMVLELNPTPNRGPAYIFYNPLVKRALRPEDV